MLIVWAMLATVLRTIRFPNDYAEAHWLIDYRFGFIKRGVIGSVTDILARANVLPQSESSIAALSLASFIIFCLVLLVVSFRILSRSDWSTESFLLVAVAVTSPFMVVSAHLVGYFDSIVIVLGFASAWLVLRKRLWLAGCVAAIAVLIHESFLLIGFPLVLLATVLATQPITLAQINFRPFVPFLVPATAFLLIVFSETLLVDREHLQQMLTLRMSSFDFIQENRAELAPQWLTTSLLEYLRAQGPLLFSRIAYLAMLQALFPSLITIFYFTLRSFRINLVSKETLLIALVTFAPLLMHAVAADTPRIWTYVILGAFGSTWLWSETMSPKTSDGSSLFPVVALPALVLNILGSFPLLDGDVERFSDPWRMIIYAPLIVGVVIILWLDHRKFNGTRRYEHGSEFDEDYYGEEMERA